MKKRSMKKEIPPAPSSSTHVLVKTREGIYWRRKRGTVKPAVLNESFVQNNELASSAFAAARRVLDALRPYMHHFLKGRAQLYFANALRRSFKANGEFMLPSLIGLDLQPSDPLKTLLKPTPIVEKENDVIRVSVLINQTCLRRFSGINKFYLEAVMLYGDCSKNKGLRTESIRSRLYDFKVIGEDHSENCELDFVLPGGKQYIVLLKASCFFDKYDDFGAPHAGMQVIGGS